MILLTTEIPCALVIKSMFVTLHAVVSMNEKLHLFNILILSMSFHVENIRTMLSKYESESFLLNCFLLFLIKMNFFQSCCG